MDDMVLVWGNSARAGRLDYLTCWFLKASKYMTESVSTNSISQGEQPAILWSEPETMKMNIYFAHRTFRWSNEARGNAAVHAIIIGFGPSQPKHRELFSYPDISGEPLMSEAQNINAYLVDAKNVFLQSRGNNINGLPEMFKGSQPTDGGHLILSLEERNQLIESEPVAAKYIKPFIGAEEFLNGKQRFCLWLKDASPTELKNMPLVLDRIGKVRSTRLKSPTASVRAFANYPTLFTQDRQPQMEYLVVPEVSSENRRYIPMGFLNPNVICSNKLQIIPKATVFMFGVMQSEMHMAWIRYTCGRLKNDYSYSPSVYNNFPWPQALAEKQVKAVETAAQRVLDVRASFVGSSLADLYDPLTMPPALVKAHQDLDRAVDLCYRPKAFDSETRRIEFLFELYEQYTAPLMAAAAANGQKGKKKTG